MKLRFLIALFALLSLATSVFAAEQRCTELGANCLCSEPLNTDTYVQYAPSPSFYDPADSVTKECTLTTAAAGLTVNWASTPTVRSVLPLTALPAGHQVQHVLSAPEAHSGNRQVGTFLQFTETARACIRWYDYHSTNFLFANDGSCDNSKFFETGLPAGQTMISDHAFGPVHNYNFTSWTPGIDCCTSGPGNGGNSHTKADWRGRWWRMEACWTNLDGNGPVNEIWAQNITDTTGPGAGEEVRIINTAASPALSHTRTAPGVINKMFVSLFRTSGGVCDGYRAVSHVLVAQWNTDAGQRIGAAVEVEGQVINNEVVSTGVTISGGVGVQ